MNFIRAFSISVVLGGHSLTFGQVPGSALTAPALAGKTLHLVIEGGESPFPVSGSYIITLSSSGNLYHQAAAGTTTASAGSWSHQSALPIADAVLTLGSYFSDGAPATLSLLDSGFYELNRSNLHSHQYGHFTLSDDGPGDPGVPPVINVQPISQTVPLGAPITLSVTASASTPITYQWRKDGIEITGANSATYSISATQPANQGTYTVVVSTSTGAMVSSPATVDIITQAPAIISQPIAVSTFTGGTAAFSVMATGFPLPSYQWKFNGVDIAGATSPIFQRSTVTSTHAGNYSCVISNSVGSTTSDTASLTVVPQPGTFDSNFRTNGSNSNSLPGTVTSIVQLPDGKLLVGGGFNQLDFSSRPGLFRLNADGTLDPSFNANLPMSPGISRVVAAPGGKIYIVGLFATVNGTSQRMIARLNADGSLDTTFAGLASSSYLVNDLAVQSDGKVVIVGAFPSVNGVNRDKLARLNTDGTLDTSFNAAGKTLSDEINTVAIGPDGRIYCGGKFLTAHGLSRPFLAAFTPTGDLDADFSSGTGFDRQLKTLLFQPDGKLLAGGEQSTYNGRASKCLTRLFADGTYDPSFISAALTATTQAGVYSLAVQANGKIVVGGAFTKVDAINRVSITRLLPDGAADPLFNPGVGTGVTNPFVNAIAIQADGGIVLGGAFTQVAGSTREKIARIAGDVTTPRLPSIISPPISKSVHAGEPVTLSVQAEASPISFQWSRNGIDIPGAVFPSLSFVSAAGIDTGSYVVKVFNASGSSESQAVTLTVDTSLVPGTLNSNFAPPSAVFTTVNAVLPLAGGRLMVGGNYVSAIASGLARINADGTLDTTFTTKVTGNVNALALQADGKILVAGFIDTVGGLSRTAIARLNADGSVDPSFNFYYNGLILYAIAVQSDGQILIGGGLGSGGFLARLASDGSTTTFGSPSAPNGPVTKIIIRSDEKIAVSGFFNTIGGASRASFALLTSTGFVDPSITSLASPAAGAIALQSTGKILIATANGRIVRRNIDGSDDTTFSYTPTDTGNYITQLLSLSDDRILAVKSYNPITDGGPPFRVIRLDTNGSADSSFVSAPGANGSVNSLWCLGSGKILVGGAFSVINTRYRPGIALLDAENPLVPAFILQPLSGAVIAGNSATLQVSATGAPTFQWKRNGIDLIGETGASLVIGAFAPSDAGLYTVAATNAEGTATSSAATLRIARLPVIKTQPSNVSSPAGSTVTLGITAESSVQPFSYQWRKNGLPMTGFVGASIVLANLSATDAGDYDVIVSNADGSTVSGIATLTIGTPTLASFVNSYGLDPLTNGAATADPDGDGLSNLFEYLVGGNPLLAESRSIPKVKTIPGSPTVFTYEFDRLKNFASLGITIQFSDDLGIWYQVISGQNNISVTATAIDATTEHVVVSFPTTAIPRFIRLNAN